MPSQLQLSITDRKEAILEMRTKGVPHLERAPQEFLVDVEKREKWVSHYPRRAREVVMMSLTS